MNEADREFEVEPAAAETSEFLAKLPDGQAFIYCRSAPDQSNRDSTADIADYGSLTGHETEYIDGVYRPRTVYAYSVTALIIAALVYMDVKRSLALLLMAVAICRWGVYNTCPTLEKTL